ncbi:MAG: pseudaminic acid cytidylyltransferase [Elusimicrobiota bacterium]|jgi:N-acylneuraminate cytidylyltransferase|nr:pseudaminic acid cytidylyltransferase [Elusimicrobiota bacterium]
MKNIAVITARGGSKRIPRKNIKEFFGKPMICYAIEAAQKSKIFNAIMVSTDDNEIAQIAKKYGAQVPFMRSKETANDFATTEDVLIEVMNEYKKLNEEFVHLCCIYPCVPFLKADALKAAYNKFLESDADSLMPIVRFSYPIQRALKINKEGFLEFREPQYIRARSQDLEPAYHDIGMFYFYKVKSLSTKERKIMYFEMKESEIQDIDAQEDWDMAELKYKIINNRVLL